MGYKVLNKNKEVAAATATSKKGRDIMKTIRNYSKIMNSILGLEISILIAELIYLAAR